MVNNLNVSINFRIGRLVRNGSGANYEFRYNAGYADGKSSIPDELIKKRQELEQVKEKHQQIQKEEKQKEKQEEKPKERQRGDGMQNNPNPTEPHITGQSVSQNTAVLSN